MYLNVGGRAISAPSAGPMNSPLHSLGQLAHFELGGLLAHAKHLRVLPTVRRAPNVVATLTRLSGVEWSRPRSLW
jgi:hypothetical protein